MKYKRLSPLRYPGGKAKILDFIIKIIEENACVNAQYVEPYAGGAGVALGLLISGYVSKIHINDVDPAISAFWEIILNNTEQFIKKIYDTKITIFEWEKQKIVYNNLENYNKFDRAFSVFFLNRSNRSGVITGGCIGGKQQNGQYKIDARFNKENLVKRIENIAQYKDKIKIYNQDTIELLEHNKKEFKNAIIYLDPPYYKKGYCLYKNYYKHNDHVKIFNIVRELYGYWIVSYDNVPQILEIYSGIKKKEFNVKYSAGNNKIGKEIMFFSNNLKIPNIKVC